jgi:hypothetical protein
VRARAWPNLAREISDFSSVCPMKATILSILGQGYLIHCLRRDELAAKEIPRRLIQVHGEHVMKKRRVFYWVREIQAGRKHLSDEARLGRPC